MDTTYELVRAAKGLLKRGNESFRELYGLSVDDVYFQLQFVMADDENITQQIEDFYVELSKSIYLLEVPDRVAEWLNTQMLIFSARWLRKNRADLTRLEMSGAYDVKKVAEPYISGMEMEDMEYIRNLAGFLRNLPEIHRQTAIAFYYSNLSDETIKEYLFIDKPVLSKRTAYIEHKLNEEMRQVCLDRGFQMKTVTTQKIRTALFELSRAYKYPYKEELYSNISFKTGK